MKRDEFTCLKCGQIGGQLEVDHYPFTFAEIMNTFIGVETVEDSYQIDFLWDSENGRTLCKKCHKKYGKQDLKITSRTLFEAISVN